MSSTRLLIPLFVAGLLTATLGGTAQAQNRYDQRERDRHDQRDYRDDRDHRGDRRGRDRDRRGSGSITIYEHANYRGRSASFDRPVHNLQSVGMNDITSSIQLRGEWIVCEHAGFRGRCERVQGNVRDLQHTGLNDRISSLRPADRNDYRR